MTEQQARDTRNAKRRALCAEYAANFARRNEIIEELGRLSEVANMEACAERLEADLAERRQQADMVRPGFAFSIAAMPEGPTEDDCGFTVDGLAGQWNKPVQA